MFSVRRFIAFVSPIHLLRCAICPEQISKRTSPRADKPQNDQVPTSSSQNDQVFSNRTFVISHTTEKFYFITNPCTRNRDSVIAENSIEKLMMVILRGLNHRLSNCLSFRVPYRVFLELPVLPSPLLTKLSVPLPVPFACLICLLMILSLLFSLKLLCGLSVEAM